MSKQIQLNFQRNQVGENKFKTTARLVWGERTNFEKQHGVIHRVVGLSDRLTGDVPSLTKTLNSIQPETIRGSAALGVVKGGYNFTRTTVKTAVKGALFTESVATGITDVATRKLVRKYQEDFVRNANDDANRGMLSAGGLIGDMYKGIKNYHQEKDRHSYHKKQLDYAKSNFIRNSTQNAQKLVAQKKNYKANKTNFQRRKQDYKSFAAEKKLETAQNSLQNFVRTATNLAEKTAFSFQFTKNSVNDVRNMSFKRQIRNAKFENRHSVYRFYFNRLSKMDKTKIFIERRNVDIFLHKARKEFVRTESKFIKSPKLAKFTRSKKSNIRKQLYKRRKKIFKQQKKDYKSFKRDVKKLDKNLKKDVKQHKKQLKNSKPLSIVSRPVNYARKKALNKGWRKAVNADSDNDFMQAAGSIVDKAQGIARNKKNHRFQQQQKKTKRLQSKIANKESKLKMREGKLKSKKYAARTRKKRQMRKQFKHSLFSAAGLKERLLKAKKLAKSGLQDIAKKLLIACIPLLIFALCTFTLLMSLVGIFSNSGFILGTYIALDNDLSEAEEYYTKLAYEMNEKLLKIQEDWKDGLEDFNVNTDDYDTAPDEFYWGASEHFPNEPAYDYNCYKLWSYLCAYFYDFESESDEIDYWEFNDEQEDACNEIFEKEYTFEHYYENLSGWQELYSWEYNGGIDGSYWLVDSTNVYYDKFYPNSNPSQFDEWKDDNGYLHYNHDTGEILNANDDNERTGWFLQDQRYYANDSAGNVCSPFYSYNGANFGRIFDDGWHIRSYFGINNEDFFRFVSPDDTKRWNSDLENTCLVSYYKQYEWVEECRLYYTITQNCTFDEAAIDILGGLDNADDRIAYYKLLANGDEDTDNVPLYGNHQSIDSPLSSGMSELLANGRIYNGYGYDIQGWNTTHCTLSTIDECHEGIDIQCDMNSQIRSPFNGKITKIDEDKHEIVIESSKDIKLWDKRHKVKITFYNVAPLDIMEEDDLIAEGTVIAKTTADRMCPEINDELGNANANCNYLHLEIEIKYGGLNPWKLIDPQLIINL